MSQDTTGRDDAPELNDDELENVAGGTGTGPTIPPLTTDPPPTFPDYPLIT